MTEHMDHCELIGRWQITEADLWEQDRLDLCGTPTLVIGTDGHGEMAFGPCRRHRS